MQRPCLLFLSRMDGCDILLFKNQTFQGRCVADEGCRLMAGALSMLVNSGSDCAGNQTTERGASRKASATQDLSTGTAASDVCCADNKTEEWQRDRSRRGICCSLVVMEGSLACGAARLQQGCPAGARGAAVTIRLVAAVRPSFHKPEIGTSDSEITWPSTRQPPIIRAGRVAVLTLQSSSRRYRLVISRLARGDWLSAEPQRWPECVTVVCSCAFQRQHSCSIRFI